MDRISALYSTYRVNYSEHNFPAPLITKRIKTFFLAEGKLIFFFLCYVMWGETCNKYKAGVISIWLQKVEIPFNEPKKFFTKPVLTKPVTSTATKLEVRIMICASWNMLLHPCFRPPEHWPACGAPTSCCLPSLHQEKSDTATKLYNNCSITGMALSDRAVLLCTTEDLWADPWLNWCWKGQMLVFWHPRLFSECPQLHSGHEQIRDGSMGIWM